MAAHNEQDRRKSVNELMQEIIREEAENEKLKRDLRAKEEEAKTLTLEARQACKDLAEAKVNMSTEKKKAMEELATLQEKNADSKRILNELNAEISSIDQEGQKKVETERTISTLKSKLDKEKRARDELKASVDELEAKFEDVLREKLELERQIIEVKRTKASNEERMDKIAKQNERIENFMIKAKCKLEKDKEKSEALDKDHRDLQDLCTGMKREVEEFLREMNEINKRMSEEHEHLQREGEKTKCEYVALKKKVRDEMNKKCVELDELKKKLQHLESQQVPRKKDGELLRRIFVCTKQ